MGFQGHSFVMAAPEGAQVTTGAVGTTVTLAKPAISLILFNIDATNSIKIGLNGSTRVLILPPGKQVVINETIFPYIIQSFSHEAVAATPALVWWAFEIDSLT